MDSLFLDIVWRVPNPPAFLVGFAIVGWALAAGVLAFTGTQASGQPEIHFPQRPPAPPEPEPEPVADVATDAEAEADG